MPTAMLKAPGLLAWLLSLKLKAAGRRDAA
jgi:hypothetical protein